MGKNGTITGVLPRIAKELAGLDHVPVTSLEPFQGDLKDLSEREYKKLKKSILDNGLIVPFFVWLETGKLLDGHQRQRVFIRECWSMDVPIVYISADSEQDAKKKLLVISSQYGRVTQDGWDDFTFDLDDEWIKQTVNFDALPLVFEDWDTSGDGGESQDAEPQINRAEELRELWGVESGQLWRLPSRVEGQEHRLICGDCTDTAVVARVMGGDVADMTHADPPYGMGKEKDGIANDNLYREKLDAFQMAWWAAQRPFLKDNGSAYIWGNAEDLWRLWYCGGLRDSERLTFRNEITWDKGNGQGMESDAHRMYPTATERALFFMLGEQGFNNNADNYWEGWEPIRAYLKSERDKVGWDNAKCKTLAGHSSTSGCHWFDASQWMMPTEEVYNAWKKAAEGAAFRKEFDELRKEFYATRAYFDNTHENMTDAWQFQRVTGEDRHGHATPKPAEMAARAIKSSCPSGGVVYVPFGGTAPELIAGENNGRFARIVELDAGYCAVILQRYADAFSITPELITEETAV